MTVTVVDFQHLACSVRSTVATEFERDACHFMEIARRREGGMRDWVRWFSREFWDHEDEDGPLLWGIMTTIWEVSDDQNFTLENATWVILGMFHQQQSIEHNGVGVWPCDYDLMADRYEKEVTV